MARKRGDRSRCRPSPRHRRVRQLTGTVRLTRAGGFVETAEGDFRLTARGARGALSGDVVRVSLHAAAHGERRAVVESTEKHATTVVVGAFHTVGPLGAIRPLDRRIRADFFVPPDDPSPADHGVADGDVVVARILSYPTAHESGVVRIERRIGGLDAPDLGIRFIMARFDLHDGCPEDALREAAALELDVDGALRDPLRRDIRDRFALTVDPGDARDFDDAISVRRTRAGGYELGVHIADVSHYVAWDSAVDMAARARSTSVYLADRVLPMLPGRLSNDLCSLRPGVDRLSVTVDIGLDDKGFPTGAEVYPSVIRSRARLTYEQADAVLMDAGGALADPDSAPAGAAAPTETARRSIVGVLKLAHELARKRDAIRRARGAVDFDTTEIHAVLDGSGLPVELATRRRTPATGLIEEAMLLANECVAERLARHGIRTAYRVHEPPIAEHLRDVAQTLAVLGIVDAPLAQGIAMCDRRAIQRVIDETENTSCASLVNSLLLRAQQRAEYRPENSGHFALGADAYCHFTSPIRRYPDLIVHRTLKLALARERLGAQDARRRVKFLIGAGSRALDAVIGEICRTAGAQARVADAASRGSQRVKVAQFFERRIGQRYPGIISWVDARGAFVRLDESGAEGLVPMRALGDEWFELDQRQLTLRGASTGLAYRLGQHVVAEVTGTDTVEGHLDLRIIRGPRALH